MDPKSLRTLLNIGALLLCLAGTAFFLHRWTVGGPVLGSQGRPSMIPEGLPGSLPQGMIDDLKEAARAAHKLECIGGDGLDRRRFPRPCDEVVPEADDALYSASSSIMSASLNLESKADQEAISKLDEVVLNAATIGRKYMAARYEVGPDHAMLEITMGKTAQKLAEGLDWYANKVHPL